MELKMKDTKDILICPACGEFMEKVFIPETGFCVDICTEGCGGIWFDNREDINFDEKSESIDKIKEALNGKVLKKPSRNGDRYCPVCASKLVKNYCSSKHEIEIDECYGCGGKFFDRGELETMRAQYETEEERVEAVNALMLKVAAPAIKEQERELNKLKKLNDRSIFAFLRNLVF